MDKLKRKLTRQINVGGVVIGGNASVAIQSMTNTKTGDSFTTLEQIKRLVECGCELVRVAVPDSAAAAALSKIVQGSSIPVIADIHFDLDLALQAIENGAAKIRINPGNIGSKNRLVTLARKAERYNVPIRIGINSGSLERNLLTKHGGATAAALAESALNSLELFENTDFTDLIFSLKASDVYTTISAYRLFAEKSEYPLHLGVTGAGPLRTGVIKGAVGIGTLLAEGIGDTIRVSLTADPVEEVLVARQIIQALGLKEYSPELISCPTCGRCEAELLPLVEEVSKMLEAYAAPLKVAVMGCVVNGPGEAREADIGIAAGKKQGLLFSHGKVIRTVALDQLLQALRDAIENEVRERNSLPGEQL